MNSETLHTILIVTIFILFIGFSIWSIVNSINSNKKYNDIITRQDNLYDICIQLVNAGKKQILEHYNELSEDTRKIILENMQTYTEWSVICRSHQLNLEWVEKLEKSIEDAINKDNK